MHVVFAHLSHTQKQKLLKHVTDFKNNPDLMEGCDPDRIERILQEIRNGGYITDEVDSHMLGIYIANTYTGENGDPFIQYLHSLGLPEDLH